MKVQHSNICTVTLYFHILSINRIEQIMYVLNFSSLVFVNMQQQYSNHCIPYHVLIFRFTVVNEGGFDMFFFTFMDHFHVSGFHVRRSCHSCVNIYCGEWDTTTINFLHPHFLRQQKKNSTIVFSLHQQNEKEYREFLSSVPLTLYVKQSRISGNNFCVEKVKCYKHTYIKMKSYYQDADADDH